MRYAPIDKPHTAVPPEAIAMLWHVQVISLMRLANMMALKKIIILYHIPRLNKSA